MWTHSFNFRSIYLNKIDFTLQRRNRLLGSNRYICLFSRDNLMRIGWKLWRMGLNAHFISSKGTKLAKLLSSKSTSYSWCPVIREHWNLLWSASTQCIENKLMSHPITVYFRQGIGFQAGWHTEPTSRKLEKLSEAMVLKLKYLSVWTDIEMSGLRFRSHWSYL